MGKGWGRETETERDRQRDRETERERERGWCINRFQAGSICLDLVRPKSQTGSAGLGTPQ